MDQSHSDSDISMSPSQILDRLQLLRQLQLMQQGKLQKQRLQYQENSDITEIVSHFSNSTSYNTFRSLLQSSQDTPSEMSPCPNLNNSSKKGNLQNVIEGVSVLNISEESEVMNNSPISSRSSILNKPNSYNEQGDEVSKTHFISKKHVSLDDMPILSPKKDFEALVAEKLKSDNIISNVNKIKPKGNSNTKKPFLKRGQGTARFGIKKKDLIIQNTKSLPWRKRHGNLQSSSASNINKCNNNALNGSNVKVQITHEPQPSPAVTVSQKCSPITVINKTDLQIDSSVINELKLQTKQPQIEIGLNSNSVGTVKLDPMVINLPKGKHPIQNSKGKTWAAVLTKEQDDFLRQLKQSDYYKNFVSPAKSVISDASCNEDHSRLIQEREQAEQNMFELLENKVTNESFNMQNSFFNRFLRNNNLNCSGESTPLVMQKYLSKNPNLLHILPDIEKKQRNQQSCSEVGECESVYSECSGSCSSLSSCCSCKTGTQCDINEESTLRPEKEITERAKVSKKVKRGQKEKEEVVKVTTENEIMNANMVEMNSKLIATSELLRDRLRELEDEIETFRKENANLTKMREEIDAERQKFYEEKSAFEQKFNEEKVLSEYYLAEEKEKLSKQKQIYERYVRDMRGRLNKKEKDEVINMKKEINDLKEEIKLKDAKSTSVIARLRNQIKIMEKDKKSLEDAVVKLNKENKRIQHSNDITRRLTNIKYLEQINKKLSNMTSKDNRSNIKLDSNVKYKGFEIERQSRARKVQQGTITSMKPRAKSVPNIHVTSRYAKYFSQKDSLSEKVNIMGLDNEDSPYVASDNMLDNFRSNSSESEDENKLEKIYNERFKSISPAPRTNSPNLEHRHESSDLSNNDFFIQRKFGINSSQTSSRGSFSKNQKPFESHTKTSNSSLSNRLSNDSRSPQSISNDEHLHNSNYCRNSNTRTRSPVSILSNRSCSSQKSDTVINRDRNSDRLIPSPEPTSSKSSLTKTKLTPTEIIKPDGTKELRFPNGNIKIISADEKYSKFIYYNGDIKENFYNEGRIKYYYAETKTYHTTHPDGLEVLEFPDGQVEKRYKDGSSEIRLPNGSIRYFDPKSDHVREEWRFPDGASLTVSANGDQRIIFANGQVEVHAKDHKRREFPDGTIKLVYNDGTSETRYASGRVRIKDKHGNLIMDSAPS